jgi:hypothetical protein
MLAHPTTDRLRELGFLGMAHALEGLGLARGDGRYSRTLKSLARVQVLILDDWGLSRCRVSLADGRPDRSGLNHRAQQLVQFGEAPYGARSHCSSRRPMI